MPKAWPTIKRTCLDEQKKQKKNFMSLLKLDKILMVADFNFILHVPIDKMKKSH